MRWSISLAVLFLGSGILGAGPATRPTLKLTDKQVLAGYEVALNASQTREGGRQKNRYESPDHGISPVMMMDRRISTLSVKACGVRERM